MGYDIKSSNDILHPSNKKFPFKNTKGEEFMSIISAFLSVATGINITLSIPNTVAILVRITFQKAKQIPAFLKAILDNDAYTLIGKNDPKHLPKVDGESNIWGMFESVGRNLWGVVLTQVRTMIIREQAAIEWVKKMASQGPIPQGTQPCHKCGTGMDRGNGWFLSNDGERIIGPCFDCCPKGNARGLGYITRSLAHRNWSYSQDPRNANKFAPMNMYSPDDDGLWKVEVKCSVCGIMLGKGVTLVVGRPETDIKTICVECKAKNMAERVVDVNPLLEVYPLFEPT